MRRTRRARLRRLSAGLLAGVALVLVVSALRPAGAGAGRAGAPGTAVVVTTRSVPAGRLVEPADVRLESRPVDEVPEGAVRALGDVVGRTAAGPLAAREVLTPGRLVGAGLLDGLSGDQLMMTLPVSPAATVGVAAGSRVDAFATATGTLVAEDVLVAAVGSGEGGVMDTGLDPTGASFAGAAAEPRSITIVVDRSQARAVARSLSAVAAGESFVVAVHPGA